MGVVYEFGKGTAGTDDGALGVVEVERRQAAVGGRLSLLPFLNDGLGRRCD